MVEQNTRIATPVEVDIPIPTDYRIGVILYILLK